METFPLFSFWSNHERINIYGHSRTICQIYSWRAYQNNCTAINISPCMVSGIWYIQKIYSLSFGRRTLWNVLLVLYWMLDFSHLIKQWNENDDNKTWTLTIHRRFIDVLTEIFYSKDVLCGISYDYYYGSFCRFRVPCFQANKAISFLWNFSIIMIP